MTIQTINLGNYANDGTGDDLRTAFKKVNANFTLLGGTVTIADGSNLGTGTGVFAQRNNTNATLEFKTLTSTDNSVIVTNTATEINLQASPSIELDTSPTLGGDLNLNNHYIYGGDVQTTVFGTNIPVLNSLVELLLASNQLDVNMGSFLQPAGSGVGTPETSLDLGFFAFPINNTLEFGSFV